MNKYFILFVAILWSTLCVSQDRSEESRAMAWLAVVDAGHYTESWQQASGFFKQSVSSKQWAVALSQIRGPLWKVLSREVHHVTPYHSLPGAPDGEYRVVTLTTRFEYKASAIETVSLSNEKNKWVVAGYFIQ